MATAPHSRVNILINEAIGLNIDVHATLLDNELQLLQKRINEQQELNRHEHDRLEAAEDAINEELFRRAGEARKGLTDQAVVLEACSKEINSPSAA